jgi:hypothetical protein
MKHPKHLNTYRLVDIARIACATAVTLKVIYELCKLIMY